MDYIDVDSKIPNLALMKISGYYKSMGEQVEFVRSNGKYERIYASAIFTRSKPVCDQLKPANRIMIYTAQRTSPVG